MKWTPSSCGRTKVCALPWGKAGLRPDRKALAGLLLTGQVGTATLRSSLGPRRHYAYHRTECVLKCSGFTRRHSCLTATTLLSRSRPPWAVQRSAGRRCALVALLSICGYLQPRFFSTTSILYRSRVPKLKTIQPTACSNLLCLQPEGYAGGPCATLKNLWMNAVNLLEVLFR